MIQVSTLNIIIIGLSMVIFTFLWRMLAARLADSNSPFAGAMAVTL